MYDYVLALLHGELQQEASSLTSSFPFPGGGAQCAMYEHFVQHDTAWYVELILVDRND